MPMGPPDENWTLPSWAVNSSNEEIQDQVQRSVTDYEAQMQMLALAPK